MSLSDKGELPRSIRMSYGVAEIGVISAEVLLRVSLLIFYTDVIGLRSDLAGYAIALATLWDAVTDPFMGRISDQRPLFNQRRRPYMVVGSLFLSLSLVVLFFPPDLSSQLGKSLYLLMGYALVNTAMTIISVPYAAFAGDLTKNENVRTELFGWRVFFGNLGFVVGTIMPALVGYFLIENEIFSQGHMDAYASVGVGGIIVVSTLWTLWMTAGLDSAEGFSQTFDFSLKSHFRDMWHVLESRDFRWILIIYFVATLGLTLNSSLALYYYRYRLQLDGVGIRFILAFFMLIFSLSIPMWVLLARRYSKYRLIAGSIFLLGVMTCIIYPLFPIGNSLYPLVGSSIGGVLVGAVVLLDVAVADISDKDSKDVSNLGLYFGFWKFMGKVSRAVALAITGHILAWIEFVPNEVQTAQTSWKLAVIFGPVVGIFLILASFLVFIAFCVKTGKTT